MPGIDGPQPWSWDFLNKNKYPKVQAYIFLFDAYLVLYAFWDVSSSFPEKKQS